MTFEKLTPESTYRSSFNSKFISQIFEEAQKSIVVDDELHSEKESFSKESFKLKVAQRMIADLEQERQSLEAKLRLLQAAVECSNDGISISNMRSDDNEIIYVSSKLEELTGYSADELVGSNWRKLYHSNPDEHARTLLRKALSLGEECQVSVRNIKKDGTPLLSKVTLYPLKNELEEVTHYVSVIQDESEKIRADQVLQQAQRLDSIGLMAGGIVHDFKNILQVILTQASIVLRKLPEDAPSRKNVERLFNAGHMATDLTDRLLKYARAEKFDFELLDVNQLIEESVRLVSSSLPLKVKLKTQLDEPPAVIQAFKGQVLQILINLILNAAESIDESGYIQVCSRLADSDEIVADAGLFGMTYISNGLDPSVRYVAIDVVDTGSGMDAETLIRVFDPFFTTKESGNGLGLPVTLGAIQAQRGGMRIKSQVAVGTTFTVYLPLYFDSDFAES